MFPLDSEWVRKPLKGFSRDVIWSDLFLNAPGGCLLEAVGGKSRSRLMVVQTTDGSDLD